MKTKRLLVLSDFHLRDPASDPIYADTLRLLRSLGQGDLLVIAGDFFDLYIGDLAVFSNRYSALLEEIGRATGERGAEIRYLEGNHDFQLGSTLVKLGVQVETDDAIRLTLGSKRFYIAHGDLVDPDDEGYLRLRRFFRSPAMRGLLRIVPERSLDWFGRSWSEKSRHTHPSPAPGEIPQIRRVFRSFAREKIASGFDFVVLGHCHDLDGCEVLVDGRVGRYLNMGYPPEHHRFVIWSADRPDFLERADLKTPLS